MLNQKTARISMAKVSELLELTSATLQCPDFGMRLAEVQSVHPFEPLDRLIKNAPNVGDVLGCASAHSEAYSCGVTTELERKGPNGQIFFRIEFPEEFADNAQLVELMALLAHYGVLRLSGSRARSREIWFLHAPRARLTTYACRFKARVRFQQDLHGLFFSETDLSAPVVGRDEGAFLKAREDFAARFPAPEVSLATRVRRAVEQAYWEGACTRKRVAELMQTHERTLLRRLSSAGTNFQEIREHVRQKLALRYLAQPNLTLTEVTGRLGYSELPVLARSCQRWFNTPPAKLRRRLRSEIRYSEAS